MQVLFGKGLATKCVVTILTTLSLERCVNECAGRPKCALVTYERLSKVCELHTEEGLQSGNIVKHPGSVVVLKTAQCSDCEPGISNIRECPSPREMRYSVERGNMYSIDSTLIVKPVFQNKTERIKCLSNGLWEFVSPVNHCPGCRDCTDAQTQGNTVDGIYYVNMTYSFYCSFHADGSAWLSFQRRKDGSVDFNRNWYNYTTGFGYFDGEFWLGLETLYQIIRTGLYTLRVDLETFKGTRYYAQYSTFRLTDAYDKYRLFVSGYEGDAGDMTIKHNGMAFTTFDSDNDGELSKNCAELYCGGGWFWACHSFHLNGLYFPNGSNTKTYANHIHWESITGHFSSLKSTEMKVRRQVVSIDTLAEANSTGINNQP